MGSTVVPPAAPAAKKHTLLPLLTILFAISYGLMTLLIVEQGATIANQRTLVHQLFGDSAELSAMKVKAARKKSNSEAQLHAQVPGTKAQNVPDPKIQAPSTQSQSGSEQVAEAPSSQAVPQHRAQSRAGRNQHPEFRMPSRPPDDLTNEYRAVKTI